MKSPCQDCIIRPICCCKTSVLCEILADYLSPSYLVIRVRFFRTREFLPNLKYVRRGKTGHWLNIPSKFAHSIDSNL